MEEQKKHPILDSYESTENALMDSFKAAALKATGLYKESLVQNRKAYAAGYQQALQDLYELISTQPESGSLPVEEVLGFTRDKSVQLNFEMSEQQSSPGSTTTSNSFNNNNNNNTHMMNQSP